MRQGDQLVARLPYSFESGKFGEKKVAMPLFSMSLGPWIRKTEAKYAKLLSAEKELYTALIEQLPKGYSFEQNFHHSVTNWLPFYWKGYRQTTAYTYILKGLKNQETIWSELQENIRRAVRKAEKTLQVRTDLGVDRFIELNRQTFARQGLEPYYSDEAVARIAEGCRKAGRGELYFAVDEKGVPHSALFVVWDSRSTYYLAGGSDPAFRSSGGMSLLMWHAIREATSHSQEFNFHGSMLEPVERFFRAFGAEQVPYLRISKPVGVSKAVHVAREIFR